MFNKFPKKFNNCRTTTAIIRFFFKFSIYSPCDAIQSLERIIKRRKAILKAFSGIALSCFVTSRWMLGIDLETFAFHGYFELWEQEIVCSGQIWWIWWVIERYNFIFGQKWANAQRSVCCCTVMQQEPVTNFDQCWSHTMNPTN